VKSLSSHMKRGRVVVAVVAAALALSSASTQAIADAGRSSDGGAPSAKTFELIVDDSTEPSPARTMQPDTETAAGSFGDYIHVGTPTFTGRYKTIVSGPHVTYVKVYVRSFKACHFYFAGAEGGSCMTGSIVYAAGFAACFNGCTVAGLRGSQDCGTESGSFPGFELTVQGCRNHLMATGPSAGYGSVAFETDQVCNEVPVISSCTTKSWHVNAYGSGNITGVYGGVGIA
jgi:hypothetical protein